MDIFVYVFEILLDVFIVFTIFAIYFYVLFRYFMHTFEENGLAKFFKVHLKFYQPLFTLYKLSYFHKQHPNYITDKLIYARDNIVDTPDKTSYAIATYSILVGILGLFTILMIYFLIFHKKIREEMKINHILIKIGINATLILLFELLFLFYVYGNTDLFNFQPILNV